MAQIVGVGGRTAIAEDDQLAAALQALVNGQRGGADLFGFFPRDLVAQPGIVLHLHLNRAATSSDQIGRLLASRWPRNG